MLLFYVRHGDPIYDPDSLTKLGERQAEAVAKRLSVYGIDKIYCSTSNRAYLTAKPTAEMLKKDITQIDFFNEENAYKYFYYINEKGEKHFIDEHKELMKKFVSNEIYNLGYKWYEHKDFEKYEFKKGIEFFEKNIDEFMLSLGYEHDREKHTYKVLKENNDRVAVFAHGEVGAVFMSSILDIPYPMYLAHIQMSHTGMTVIEFNNDDKEITPKLLTYSNDGHLYKEGLPTKYANRVNI